MKVKNNKFKVPAYVSRDIGVMIEDFKGTLDLVVEQTIQIPQIKEDISVLKKDIQEVKSDVAVLKKDLVDVKDDIGTIKIDIEQIKHDLKNKIDRTEFAILERRVALLESRR